MSKAALADACGAGDLKVIEGMLQRPQDPNLGDAGVNLEDGGALPLHAAANSGRVEAVTLLLEANADPDSQDEYLQTPLHLAAMEGHAQVAFRLLKANANPDAQALAHDSTGLTPLEAASSGDHVEVAQFLLEARADPNRFSKAHQTPLHRARSLEMIRLLLGAAADVNLGQSKDGKDCHTALDAAAEEGPFARAQLLLDFASEQTKSRALQSASRSGRADVVQLLLLAGAHKFPAHRSHSPPLASAAKRGFLDVARLLLDAGVDVDEATVRNETPLLRACEQGNLSMVRLLLESRADTGKLDDRGRTPLCVAAKGFLLLPRRAGIEIIGLLLQAGASAEKATDLLVAACAKGHVELVSQLLEAGADINSAWCHCGNVRYPCLQQHSHCGWTPLGAAASAGHANAVAVLLQAGADPDLQSQCQHSGTHTPLDRAAARGHVEVARLLLEAGAKVRATGPHSPLAIASWFGHLDVMRLLLAVADHADKTAALVTACLEGHAAQVDIFLQAGVDEGQALKAVTENNRVKALGLMQSHPGSDPSFRSRFEF